MRFTQTLFASAALVAAALADVSFTQGPGSDGVKSGDVVTLKWTPADDTPTTIILRKGPGDNLDTISTLTESATSGTFAWTVDTSLPNADDYALEIKQGSDVNYWGPFKLTGSTATAISSAASSTAASTASSKSSSASTTKAPSSSATHASASNSISFSGNSTISSATLSRSVTGSGSGSATPTGTATGTGSSSVPTTGAASVVGASPIALIFGAVAAVAYFH